MLFFFLVFADHCFSLFFFYYLWSSTLPVKATFFPPKDFSRDPLCGTRSWLRFSISFLFFFLFLVCVVVAPPLPF